MSFSKAKIHRFNDDIPCAPPPGTYNPEIINKTVGPIIYKTERFSESKYNNLNSSTESLNNLCERNDSCRHSCFSFKTPKLPLSSFKTFSNTDVKRKMDFSQKKAASTEQINKHDFSDFEISSLKYNLNMIQEELVIEKDRAEKLLRELTRLKRDNEQSEQFINTMVDVIFEKNNIIVTLKEKIFVLQSSANESFESYYNHIKNVFSIFQTYSEEILPSNDKYSNIIERYENLISEYEYDFEQVTNFFSSLLQKQNNLKYDHVFSKESGDERVTRLVETLKSTGNEIRKYEMVIQEMQKVINVLSNRILESDQEVDKKNDEIKLIVEEKEKLNIQIQNKEEEIKTLQNMINNAAQYFVDEVQTKEKDLLNMVDDFKKKAAKEKENYEESLLEKNEKVFELLAEKNQIDLDLQEALDEIETLKCKEETLTNILQQLRNESAEKFSKMKTELKECRQKIQEWQKFYEENHTNKLENLEVEGEKSIYMNGYNKDKNEDVVFPEFVKKIVDFISEKIVYLSADTVIEIEKIAQTNDWEKSLELIGNILINFQQRRPDNGGVWIRDLLNFIYDIFYKFENENKSLKNDLARLHNDFIEKCDECAQLTRLLQISEKQIELTEKKTNELESCQKDWESKCSSQQKEIEALKSEIIALEQKLAEDKSDKITVKSDTEKMEEKLLLVENTLKEECIKNQDLEKQNMKLQKLIGPYRQHLEKYESESKCLSAKNDTELFQKYVKVLDQQNQKLKVKQIIKLRNDVTQLKKKNEELSVEISKYKKTTLKPGKENKILSKNKGTFGVKTPATEVSVNATYIITSPKVNRI